MYHWGSGKRPGKALGQQKKARGGGTSALNTQTDWTYENKIDINAMVGYREVIITLAKNPPREDEMSYQE